MKLIRKFLRKACPHRFSWPRTAADGRYYQVCLACGSVYEYDWDFMRRTGRVFTEAPQHGSAAL